MATCKQVPSLPPIPEPIPITSRAVYPMSLIKIQKCLGAAFCAALGGTLSKYAFSDDTSVAYKVVLIPSAIGSNAIGLSIFVDFMHRVGSVEATFMVKAVECIITAVIGFVVFHEQLSLNWLLGTILILCGVYVLNQADSDTVTMTTKKRK